MSRYPKAEWVPWQYLSPDGRKTYYKHGNTPQAVVLHIMQGWARTARQWAMAGHFGASWHYTVARDGSVMQHLEHTDGGYHAGITDAQARDFPPIWPLWKGLGKNVNHYTIGIEHEGFPDEPWPEPQRRASADLLDWLAGDLSIPIPTSDAMVAGACGPGDRYLLHYPPHAAIDRINRVNDFAPMAKRVEYYEWLKARGGDELTPEERAMLTELWRRTGGDAGKNFDLLASIQNQQRALTGHIEDHPEGVDSVPEHRHTLSSVNVTGGLQK